MIFEFLRLGIEVTDDDFNAIYPAAIRRSADRHWSSVAVSKTASEFLVTRRGTQVLDVGSGAGKFCMVGAAHTQGYFTGVEQRQSLVDLATRLSIQYRLPNVKYIQGSFTSVDFKHYDAFFFNSSYENIDVQGNTEGSIHLDVENYDRYSQYMDGQLSRLPSGTRLATYYTPCAAVPDNFQLVDSLHGGLLNLWEKFS